LLKASRRIAHRCHWISRRGAVDYGRDIQSEKEARLDFPHGIYGCIRNGETPHPHVEALARRLGSNFRLVRIDGFDELFADVGKETAPVAALQAFDKWPAYRNNSLP
jgi:hypothetical protein